MNDMINSHESIRIVEDAVTAQMRGSYGNTSLLLAYEEVIRLAKIGEHAEKIKELPTAQPNLQECEKCIFKPFKQFQPERKKGEWEHINGDEWMCSECGNVIFTEGSWEHPLERGKYYCENCGADMRGAEND